MDDKEKIISYNYWKKNNNNQAYKHYKEIYNLLGIKGKNLINDYIKETPTLFSSKNYYYVVKNKTKNKYKGKKSIKELLIFDIETANVYWLSVIEPNKIKN